MQAVRRFFTVTVLAAACGTALALSACSTPGMLRTNQVASSALRTPAGLDPAVTKFIEPIVSAGDFELVYATLAALPERLRTNVIIWAGDRFVSNRPEFVTEANADIPEASATSTPIPCLPGDPGGCTGLYRQHKTAAASYGYVSATVNVPCGTSHLEPTESDYLYFTHVDSAGDAFENGLEFNTTPSNLGGHPSSVIPYFKSTLAKNEVYWTPTHLACDQTGVVMESFVLQTSPSAAAEPVFVVTAKYKNAFQKSGCNAPGTCTITFIPNPYGLSPTTFSQPCPGCSVRYTTSIAVPPGSKFISIPGSYFGIENEATCNPRKPAVQWTGVQAGTYATTGPTAPVALKPFPTASIVNDPTNAVAMHYFLLSGSNPNETMGIDETALQVCAR